LKHLGIVNLISPPRVPPRLAARPRPHKRSKIPWASRTASSDALIAVGPGLADPTDQGFSSLATRVDKHALVALVPDRAIVRMLVTQTLRVFSMVSPGNPRVDALRWLVRGRVSPPASIVSTVPVLCALVGDRRMAITRSSSSDRRRKVNDDRRHETRSSARLEDGLPQAVSGQIERDGEMTAATWAAPGRATVSTASSSPPSTTGSAKMPWCPPNNGSHPEGSMSSSGFVLQFCGLVLPFGPASFALQHSNATPIAPGASRMNNVVGHLISWHGAGLHAGALNALLSSRPIGRHKILG